MNRSKIKILRLTGAEQTDPLTQNALRSVDDGAEAILAVVDAADDASHETALDALKAICAVIDVPVIGTEKIRRMEDVKKLLYAGCKRAALDETSLSDEALVSEVTGKFGCDRLAALLQTPGKEPDASDSAKTAAGELKRLIPADDSISPASVSNEEAAVDFLLDEGILPAALHAAIPWANLKKGPDGLVPVVVQDFRTDEVLMVAWMNEEAYDRTIRTGRMTYYSRSRQSLWIKGETSGHYQYVRSLTADCDLDTILAKVRQIGAACHTGSRSCFFNGIAEREDTFKNPQQVLNDVYAVIADRKVHPKEGSYTNYLFDKGIDKILKKCGEEATEIVIAAKNPGDNEIIYEISDFLYHVMVLMVEKGVTWEEITDELARR
ncbi:MAG: bifunctional phosphoribosyl-AMP cyclohydrolase/phosphoribosyl-ATP diphosphatase HisIE [Lachnospiraceae bacterium]|nr:bifunctional phosphoribosyl-AMP cyclohydrolase/phosphoribosyl-ATP diphosphatase HisIE [Lachnospiraceae bacterium]